MQRLPESSEQSAVADPCAAARCDGSAATAVVLRLGGRDRTVRFCEAHAARRRAAPGGTVQA